MTSQTLWFFVFPWVAAVVTSMVSRWRRLTAVAGMVTAATLWLLLRAAPEAQQSLHVLGRSLILTESVRGLFLFVYAGVGLLFMLAFVFPQGGKFIPATLAALSPLLAALMIRPSLLGAICLAAGLVLLAVAVQDDRAGDVQAGLRLLVMAALALPFFLTAGWLADTQAAAAAAMISRCVLLGGLILLAAFPFHVWATTLTREASPLAWALVLGLGQLVIVTFVFSLLPGPVDVQTTRLVHLVGAVTLLLAVLLLVTAVTFNRLLAGLLLVDMTSVVLLLVFPEVGWGTAVTLLITRFGSLLLIGLAVLWWPQPGGIVLAATAEADEARPQRGAGRRAPWTLAALLLGCFSLLGMPLTPGFGGRWLGVQLLVRASEEGTAVGGWLPFLLLAALGVGGAALWRAAHYWLAVDEGLAASQPVEPRWRQGLLALCLLVVLGLALQPQLIMGYAASLAGWLGQ